MKTRVLLALLLLCVAASAGADGEVRTRAQLIANLRSGKTQFDRIEVMQQRIHLFGDSAMLAGREAIRGRSADGPFDRAIRFIAVFAKRGDRWQEVYFQTTPIARP